ncbi:MAG: cytochrome b N-terminal domain-containing protein [Planctomycetota bacterium]|nr:cytochrome b N-terminal domain-containing protein [Planctomycetota bacterium]
MSAVGDQVRKFLDESVYQSVIWKSVFRHGFPDTDRNRTLVVLSNLFLHLHPAKLKGHAVRMRYTWCMGGLSFFMFLILTISGVFLMFYYRPTPEYAYQDIVALREDVPLGMFMRNVHRWGAHSMVLIVWLHMLRVFMTGSYKAPREFNWAIGVILLKLTLLLSFTGYLLPWDQLAIWAITVGTNMARATPFLGHEGPGASLIGYDDFKVVHSKSDIRFALLGGSIVGPSALLRFYVLHCVFLPLVAGFLMAVHFWRIRKDGFSAPL